MQLRCDNSGLFCKPVIRVFTGKPLLSLWHSPPSRRFSNAGIPVVLLDRDSTPFPQRSEFDLVTSDNSAGGRLLAEHLLKFGCQRLAFVARPNFPSMVELRISGVRDTLLRHQLELPRDWIQTGDPEDVKFVRSLTAGRRWDAVVCANDQTAAQLMRALEQIMFAFRATCGW